VFFSIIIPTYNRAELLPETIRSVQNQSFEDWECIVVDDGSSDQTKAVVTEITRSDSRIKYIYQKNAERSAARNNGIKNSSGEYICFLDSDDRFMPNHLQDLKVFIETIESKKCMIVNDMLIDEHSKLKTSLLPEISKNTVEFLYVNPITPSRVCIHASILEKEQFDEDIVIVEDRMLWMRIAQNYPIYISRHIGVKYLLHDSNSVNLKGNGAIKTYEGVVLGMKRYPIVFDKIDKKVKRDMESRVKTNIAYHYFLNGYKWKALFWLIKAFITVPFHSQTKMRLYQMYVIMVGRKLDLAC